MARTLYIVKVLGHEVESGKHVVLPYYFLTKKAAQEMVRREEKYTGHLFGSGSTEWVQSCTMMMEETLRDEYYKSLRSC